MLLLELMLLERVFQVRGKAPLISAISNKHLYRDRQPRFVAHLDLSKAPMLVVVVVVVVAVVVAVAVFTVLW